MYDLIKKYEGFKSHSYQCPSGIWTIGYGSTYMNDEPVKKGMKITQQEAENLLHKWIEKEVLPYIKDLTLKEKQKEALISLIYNIGGPAFQKSKLRIAIKNNDYSEICKQWDFGFNSGLKGLIKRRIEELYIFINEI